MLLQALIFPCASYLKIMKGRVTRLKVRKRPIWKKFLVIIHNKSHLPKMFGSTTSTLFPHLSLSWAKSSHKLHPFSFMKKTIIIAMFFIDYYLHLFLQVTACSLIIMVGVVCSCVGSYSAIKRIAESMGWLNQRFKSH